MKTSLKSPRVTALAVLFVALAVGCGSSDDRSSPSSEEPVAGAEPVFKERKDSLYVLAPKIWLTRTIPVCWESPNYHDAAENNARAWVRDSVKRGWERVADVTFTGWGACNGAYNGIRIIVHEGEAYTEGLGSDLNWSWNNMFLNFTFRYWSTNCASSLERCIRMYASHEFGHALGFAHEQLRDDNYGQCNRQQANGDMAGDTKLGAFDTESVMNYCSYTVNSGTGELSKGDIQNVQRIYGAKPGSIVGAHGKCLETVGLGTANWTRAEMWDCDPAYASQRWTRVSSNDSIRHNNSNRCLDVYYGYTASGTDTQIYDCNGGVGGQKWLFENVAISGFNGKCLDVVNGATAAGSRLQIWDCNGTNAQKWKLTPSGEIRNVGSGRCLDLVNGYTTNNSPTQISDCNGASTQKWALESGGRLRNLWGSRCLDVQGASGYSGTGAVIYDCNGQTNQRWHLSGPIIGGASRRCLDVRGGVPLPPTPVTLANGTMAQIWDCNGTEAQVWNYFP